MTTSRSRAFLPGHDEDCNCYGCEELRLDGRQRKRRPSDASDMSLDELIAGQDAGKVPGEAYRAKMELSFGLDPAQQLRDDLAQAWWRRYGYGPDDGGSSTPGLDWS